MGTLYLRGKTWWMKYYDQGRPMRKSTGEKVKMRAKEVLKRVEGEVAEGKRPYIDFANTKYTQLVSLIENDYKMNKQKMNTLKTRLNNLEYFKNYSAQKITSVSVLEYVGFRLSEGAANASVNRELSALKRMFKLAKEQTPPLIDKIPNIKMLKEKNTRKGFFEHEEFLEIRKNLPEFLKPVITFAYYFGWRKEEILNLKWSSVDREKWIARLEVGESKSEEGRTVYLNDELKLIFQELWNTRKEKGIILPWVFPNRKHTDRIKDIRKVWPKAFEGTGIEYKLFHDLRRTAVRNMVRAGIPERVAMLLSGHKTRSVFDRYNIVNDNDLKNAQKSINNFMGTISGTISDFKQKKSP